VPAGYRTSGVSCRADAAALPANRSAGALAGDHRLRQLTHDPERERLLKLDAPGLQRAPTDYWTAVPPLGHDAVANTRLIVL